MKIATLALAGALLLLGATGFSVSSYSVVINFSDAEIPNRAGNQLVLSNVPKPVESLQLFRNGLLQTPGTDFSMAGFFVVPSAPIEPSDRFVAYYRY